MSANVETLLCGIWDTSTAISRARSIGAHNPRPPVNHRPQSFSETRGSAAGDVPPFAGRMDRHTESPPQVVRGDVLVEGGRIAAVGEVRDSADRVIDCT